MLVTARTKRRPDWSLRGLLVLSILLPALLFGWTAWDRYGQMLDEAEKTATRTVALLSEHVAGVFETHEVLLREVDRRIRGRSWEEIERDATLWSDLHDIKSDMRQIVHLLLVDGSGRVRASSDGRALMLDVADRSYFLAQKAPDAGTYMSASFKGRISGSQIIGISRRRSMADGSFDGVIVASVPAALFAGFWEKTVPTIAHDIPLIRADGEVILSYPAKSAGEAGSDGSFLERVSAASTGFSDAVSRIDGIRRLTAYTQVSHYPIYIGLSIEKNVVLSSWRSDLAIDLLYTLFSMAALMGMTMSVIRHYRAERADAVLWQESADQLQNEMERRERAEAALRQSQKMEVVGQITGGVAHDFNNLLQAISSSLYLLSFRVDADGQALVGASMQAVDRGAKLVRQLMAFSRQQPLDPQPVSLHTLVSGMGDLIQKAVGEEIRVEVEIDRDIARAMADQTQTELAILNLAINARDAMDGCGRICISARAIVVMHAEKEGIIEPGRYVVLSVSDTGSGMPADVLALAFDPFFTTKPVGKGTGLGLSMVHGFAAQSGGGAEIETVLGRGTTVRLYLPCASLDLGLDEPPASSPVATSSGETVLLVDDDGLVRMGTALALRDVGYRVLEANGGSEALSLLEREIKIDVVVTDYAMPGISGPVLVTKIREIVPKMPVIMMTGYASSIDESELGVSAVLRKPFPVAELAVRISQIVVAGGAPTSISRKTAETPIADTSEALDFLS